MERYASSALKRREMRSGLHRETETGAKNSMRFYLAPMEGITGYVYRKTYQELFHNVDKYFIPFVEPHQKRDFNAKELNEISRENNQGYCVPQILTNQAEGFLRTAQALAEQGYEEVNLNLGCPSGTVVAKGKGAGFLEYPEKLDLFLRKIFASAPCRISIKTRIGRYEPEEFGRLLEIYRQYPLEELIIHPRSREDYYAGTPNWPVFAEALRCSEDTAKMLRCSEDTAKMLRCSEDTARMLRCSEDTAEMPRYGREEMGKSQEGSLRRQGTWPVCYNGDIFSAADYKRLLTAFPTLSTVMLGRGIIGNPCLIDEIKAADRLENGWEQEKDPVSGFKKDQHPGRDWDKIREFHDLIYQRYQETLSGDRPLLFKMKELWCYLGSLYPGQEKQIKKLKKVQKKGEYEILAGNIFDIL